MNGRGKNIKSSTPTQRKPLASERLFHPKTDYVQIFFRYASTPPKTFVFDASRPKPRLSLFLE